MNRKQQEAFDLATRVIERPDTTPQKKADIVHGIMLCAVWLDGSSEELDALNQSYSDQVRSVMLAEMVDEAMNQ